MDRQLERIQFVDQVFGYLNDLAGRIQLPAESKLVYDYVRKEGVYAHPTVSGDGGVRFNDQRIIDAVRGRPTHKLRVVVTFRSDARRAENFRKIWEKRCSAAYSQFPHAILLKHGTGKEPLSLAITLLHEAGHAERAFKEKRMGTHTEPEGTTLPRRVLLEERDMHWRDHEIYKLLGKGNYVAALNACFSQFHDAAGDVSGPFFCRPSDSFFAAEVNPHLDKFLGEVPNQSALHRRYDAVIVQANLEWVARRNSKERRQKIRQLQANVMGICYGVSGHHKQPVKKLPKKK